MKWTVIFTLVISFFTLTSYSQIRSTHFFEFDPGSVYSYQDSTPENYFDNEYLNFSTFDTIPSPRWYSTDTGKSLIASGALIGLGLYTYKDNGFLNRVTTKEQINRYLPGFENHLDDYLCNEIIQK